MPPGLGVAAIPPRWMSRKVRSTYWIADFASAEELTAYPERRGVDLADVTEEPGEECGVYTALPGHPLHQRRRDL